MTNPTADAAKLLPCPTCKSEKSEWRGAYVADGKVQTCRDPYHDSRPQPAPPAGEPDFAALACQIGFEHDEEWSELEISYGGGGRNINRHRLIEIIETLAEKMYRLGLAARPKVEDAEVAYAIGALRNPAFMAGDGAPQHKAEQCRCDRETAADLLERLAGELAERGAELARVDAVIYENMIGMRVSEDFTAACTRHAARQQRKASAEQTPSKAGEAR